MSGLYINDISFLQLIGLYGRVIGVCTEVVSIVDFVESKVKMKTLHRQQIFSQLFSIKSTI